MITGVAHTALLVLDYEEAKRFYCDKLGFLVAEDTPLPNGKRWVRLLAPGGRGSEILLSRAADEAQRAQVGKQAGGRVLFFFHTSDFDADFEALCKVGVEFTEGPRTEPYGKVGIFKDLYGNRIDLIEPLAPLATLPDQPIGKFVLRELKDPNGTEAAFSVLKELRTELTVESFREAFLLARRADNYRLVGVFQDKECVALMGYRVLHDFVHGTHLYVDDLVTRPAYRSQGIGSALLQFAEKQAQRQQCTGLRLCTGDQNTKARSFYEREGWALRSVVYKKKADELN